jgi:hypothetical protein
MDNNEFLNILYENLNRYFSLDEIRTINFNMGIDYDSIPGEAKPAKIRELLIILGRQGKLPDLLGLVNRYRPNANWPPMPKNFEIPSTGEWAASSKQVQNVHDGDVTYGNKIGGDNVQGDKFTGDKISGDKIGGDKISVGNISGSTGIAIGRSAQSNVKSTTVHQSGATEIFASIFAPLQELVATESPSSVRYVNELKEEVSRGPEAEDRMIARHIRVLMDEVPSSRSTIVSIFKNPQVSPAAGEFTQFILESF